MVTFAIIGHFFTFDGTWWPEGGSCQVFLSCYQQLGSAAGAQQILGSWIAQVWPQWPPEVEIFVFRKFLINPT